MAATFWTGWPRHTYPAFTTILAGLGLMFIRELVADLIGLALIIGGGIALISVSYQHLLRATRSPQQQRRRRRLLVTYLFVGLSVAFSIWRTVEHQWPKQPPTPNTIRVKYSSTQTVQISNEPGEYISSLNLDNVGALVYIGGPNDLNAIRLGLATGVPKTVDRPGGKARGLTVIPYSREFVFHRTQSPAHTIEIGDRRFRVALLWITDKSTPTHPLFMEYRFGINEE
jgi:hypothetical protein